MKFNPMSNDRHETQSKLKHFEFVNAMDVFHKECKLYGFTDE